MAATALDAYDCHFQGRFIFDNDKDIYAAKKMGITNLNKKYELIVENTTPNKNGKITQNVCDRFDSCRNSWFLSVPLQKIKN